MCMFFFEVFLCNTESSKTCLSRNKISKLRKVHILLNTNVLVSLVVIDMLLIYNLDWWVRWTAGQTRLCGGAVASLVFSPRKMMAITRAVSTLVSSFRPAVQFWSDSSICLHLPCTVLVSNSFQPVKKLLMKEVNSETIVQHPNVEARVKTNDWAAAPGGSQKDIYHAWAKKRLLNK